MKILTGGAHIRLDERLERIFEKVSLKEGKRG